MGKTVFWTAIIVFLIVADVTKAAPFWNARKLTAPSPKEDPNTTVSPIPSPVLGEKQSSTVGSEEKAKEKKDQQSNPASTHEQDKVKDKEVKNNTALSPPNDAKVDGKVEKGTPKEEVKEKGESKPDLPNGGKESCDGIEIGRRCQDTKSMIACVKSYDDVSKALVLLIQNQGDSSLKVDLTTPSSSNKQNVIDVAKHQTKKVNITLSEGETNEITLSAGNGNCVLWLPQGAPASLGNYFQWVPPSYSKFMTPVYGAYVLLATTLISLAICGCCWFGRRKRNSETIPYQELELSVPESAANVVSTAEGWDEVWDDDWDEEKAVTSPGGKSISANGLTSRTPNKDGWEDWDD